MKLSDNPRSPKYQAPRGPHRPATPTASAPLRVRPGDVLAVRTPGSLFTPQGLIRLGAALRGDPNLSNHVAVAHHYDSHDTLWVIEGRPGGVGWRQANDYMTNRWTLTNYSQFKSPQQRATVCDTVVKLIGTGYDWVAIAADAADDLNFDWSPTWHGNKVPGHVVCSSLACYAYDKAGLSRPPGNPRTDQPADWDAFIIQNGYNAS